MSYIQTNTNHLKRLSSCIKDDFHLFYIRGKIIQLDLIWFSSIFQFNFKILMVLQRGVVQDIET